MDEYEKNVLSEHITTQNQLSRLLEYHDDFREQFSAIREDMGMIKDALHNEKIARLGEIQKIKDELHTRINTILYSILGGAGLFISGVIMFIIQEKFSK